MDTALSEKQRSDMPCTMRPAVLLFLSRCTPRLCNSYTQMYYAQYNQMTDFETEYVLCKDNRLVLYLHLHLCI